MTRCRQVVISNNKQTTFLFSNSATFSRRELVANEVWKCHVRSDIAILTSQIERKWVEKWLTNYAEKQKISHVMYSIVSNPICTTAKTTHGDANAHIVCTEVIVSKSVFLDRVAQIDRTLILAVISRTWPCWHRDR